MNVELIGIAPTPRRVARTGDVELHVGFGCIGFRAADVGANAIRSGTGRRELRRNRIAGGVDVRIGHGLIGHALFGRIAAFHDGRGGKVRCELQFDVHVRLRHDRAVRVERDHRDLRRRPGRCHEVGLESDLHAAGESGERLTIADRKVRNVGRVGVDAIGHRIWQIGSDRHARRCAAGVVERDRRLQNIRAHRRCILGPEPLAAERIGGILIPRVVGQLARDLVIRRCSGNRRAEEIGAGRARRDAFAGERRGRGQRERHAEIRRLEFRDAEAAVDRLAVAGARVDVVVAERRVLVDHDGNRRRAVRVERDAR